MRYSIIKGDENPAQHDYEVDRAGRENWKRSVDWKSDWNVGRVEGSATMDLLQMLRTADPLAAASDVLQRTNSGLHHRSVSDAVALASAELVMRQPGIVPLHAVTSTNALNYLMASVADDRLRKWLLLQNVSFVSHFASAAKARGKLEDQQIDKLVPSQEKLDVEQALASKDRAASAAQILNLAQDPAGAYEVVRKARELVFLKGTDAHDYKFSSAALEDYQLISPAFRAQYLAGCSYLFKTGSDANAPLAKRLGVAQS